jgi:hypothetical protein
MAPARCGSGGGLLLLQRVRLQSMVVVDLRILDALVLDAGLPVVVVPLLLLLDLMLNL